MANQKSSSDHLEIVIGKFVDELRNTLVNLTDFQFEATISFGESTSSNDCQLLYFRELISSIMHMSDYFKTVLLQINNKTNVYNTIGVGSVLDTAVDIFDDKQSYLSELGATPAVEMGGGLGTGFQLYCDDQMVITGGGGGGGGISIARSGTSEYLFELGGGGGGGMQFASQFKEHAGDNMSYFSVGGGGGCDGRSNSIDPADLFPINLNCGHLQDNDTMSPSSLRTLLHRQFSHKQFAQCGDVVVLGGGGGGGGCEGGCGPASLGFGFSFSLVGSKVRRVAAQNVLPRTRYATDSFSSDSRINGSRDSRIVNELYKDAAIQHCTGQLSDWCCVCSAAQRRVETCLSTAALPVAYAAANCSLVRDNARQVAWMPAVKCCSSWSTPSHKVTRAKHSSVSNTGQDSQLLRHQPHGAHTSQFSQYFSFAANSSDNSETDSAADSAAYITALQRHVDEYVAEKHGAVPSDLSLDSAPCCSGRTGLNCSVSVALNSTAAGNMSSTDRLVPQQPRDQLGMSAPIRDKLSSSSLLGPVFLCVLLGVLAVSIIGAMSKVVSVLVSTKQQSPSRRRRWSGLPSPASETEWEYSEL